MGHSLRDSVTHYIDHLEDAAWVESLVGQYGLVQVLQSCIDVLTEQNPSDVHQVTTLLLDIGRTGVMMKDDFVAEVRALMPAGVLPGLRSLLRAPDLSVRMGAIGTIGRLSFAAEAEALRHAFPSYLDRDPLCLPRLLRELGWLGDHRGVDARVKRMIGHKHYLFRWSALEYLDSMSLPSQPAERELRRRSAWLRTLSRDPAPPVAAEASHQLAELEFEIAGRQAAWRPKAEWRNKRRALEKARPPMTFSLVEIRFLNNMARRKQADYTIEELDTFVRGL
jgi:hypothetical protein